MKPWLKIQDKDPELYGLIDRELERQRNGIELIASENFASEETILSMANVFTNKYAEGRPKKRYYGGCEVVDQMESIAIERACSLFNANFANVQPHSGAQANAAILLALATPGDSILGLNLSHGGHLTHGSPVNFSGVYFKPFFYGVDESSERLNYSQILAQAKEIQPKVIFAGASAYPRQIDFKKFREIAVEAWYAMAEKSPLAKEALDSNLAYMKKIGLLD